jgi:hypothetical protein
MTVPASKAGEILAVVAIVPLVVGRVITTEPAVAGADNVTVPLVSPEITTLAILFSLWILGLNC